LNLLVGCYGLVVTFCFVVVVVGCCPVVRLRYILRLLPVYVRCSVTRCYVDVVVWLLVDWLFRLVGYVCCCCWLVTVTLRYVVVVVVVTFCLFALPFVTFGYIVCCSFC